MTVLTRTSKTNTNWGIQVCVGNVVVFAIKDTEVGPRSKRATDLADAIVESGLPMMLSDREIYGLGIDLTDDVVQELARLIKENNELKRKMCLLPDIIDQAIGDLKVARQGGVLAKTCLENVRLKQQVVELRSLVKQYELLLGVE